MKQFDKILAALCFLLGAFILSSAFSVGAAAMVLLVGCSLVVLFILRQAEDNVFLRRIFLVGLLPRVALGTFIYLYDLYDFFGPDAKFYDFFGKTLIGIWNGTKIIAKSDYYGQRAMATSGAGWGMNYLVGSIYYIFGPNMLAAQFFFAVIGAAIAPLIYYYAYNIFDNRRVGKTAAVIVALFPAFIVWTAQMLKDGLVIFLLVVSLVAVFELQKRVNYKFVILLFFSLLGLVTLRFYVAYITTVAVFGSFIAGQSTSFKSTLQRIAGLVVLAAGLGYLGLYRTAGQDYEQYGSLERIQISREYLSKEGKSGYVADDNVSTAGGALAALPIGFLYLLLAPFPWQMSNFRQVVILPEMIVWWGMIPFIISGLLYTIKHRLRGAIGILVFTLLLTLGYSIFQGNVGTAYRQRTQIQVFLFIFVAVGYTIRQEKRENKEFTRLRSLQRIGQNVRARTQRFPPVPKT